MTEPNIPSQPAATVSEQYLIDETRKARASLITTRVTCICAALGTIAYLSIMTSHFQGYVEPVSAANMATGMIAQKVDDSGTDIVYQVKQQIPILIAQVPGYAEQQLPLYRQRLEDQFEKDLTTNLDQSSKDLDTNLDGYLTDNKDQIKSVLASGQDPAAVAKLGDGISQEFLSSLKTTTIGGETIQSKLDSSLDALTQVQKKMDRLANAKDLTPQEKKTRHAIATMTTIINTATPQPTAVAVALNSNASSTIQSPLQ